MTLPQLLDRLLTAIQSQFYQGEYRAFSRDHQALTKAIARYGFECEQRGWDFTPDQILSDILQVLREIKRTNATIDYLPLYLDGAIKRHIGQRAEELQALARSTPRNVAKIVEGLQKVEAIRQPTTTETLAALYQSLKKKSKQLRRPRLAQQTTLAL